MLIEILKRFERFERQRALETELNCVFVRINPDEPDFNIYREIKYIDTLINQLYNKLNNKLKNQ